MEWRRFFRSWKGTRLENQWGRWFVAGLLVLCIILGINAIVKDTTVVLTPPELTKAVEISRNNASQDYLEAWSWSIATLLGNITPANADFVRKGMEPLLAPEIFHDVVTVIDRTVLDIKESRISSRFDVRKVEYEIDAKKWFVTGYRVIGGPATEDKNKREETTYEFSWVIRHHRPQLTFLTNYVGPPLTSKERERRDQIRDRTQRMEAHRQRIEKEN